MSFDELLKTFIPTKNLFTKIQQAVIKTYLDIVVDSNEEDIFNKCLYSVEIWSVCHELYA
jgi:hypothetical protein